MKIIVSFSGGKDSLACLIWAVNKYGNKNIEAVFCDTGWEHELTYKHIDEVVKKLDVKLITLRSKKYNGFVDLAVQKKRMPSVKARFCTTELKVIPMIDYILSQTEHLQIIQGIRAEESESRAKMKEECSYFKYYFQPYRTNKKGKPVFHTYRKKEVIEWRKKYADDILRPFFNETGTGIMKFILQNGLKPNPLYYQGMKRVGCFPCIMCGINEIKEIKQNHPEYLDRIKAAEKKSNSTFFRPDYIPKRYLKITDPKSGKKIARIEDVENYINDKLATGDMFKEDKQEAKSCMSIYNLCE
jgi:3'-phosphoadenosine 5'-phosphosulfate sulfotransferase (PAPS reductase)/FAD synthetase